jgi:hypothetical protein
MATAATTDQAAALSTRNIIAKKKRARPSAGSPTCQMPPTKKKIAAATAMDIPDTAIMRATTTNGETGWTGGGSSIYSLDGIIAPRRSSIKREAMRAVTPAES